MDSREELKYSMMQNINPLDLRDARAVIERYRARFRKHGVTALSLSSGSAEKQRIRHQVHATALQYPMPRVLDIGSGLGDFYTFLKGSDHPCIYTGYDIVPEYIAACRQRFPEAQFELRNIFTSGIDGLYDTIVMSQVLNNRYRHSDNLAVIRETLGLAYRHTRVSVTVDMMSTYVDFQDPDLFYYAPDQIFSIAKTIARRVRLRHDYRPFEFCIQLFHDEAEGFVE